MDNFKHIYLQSIRRLLEHDSSGTICPSCRISFDKGKRRKLIDTCGHERCYSCMFRNDQCPMCMNSNSSLKDVDCNSNAQGYDTGIGGSTSTIVSPLGSPQPQLRSQVQQQHHQQQQQLLQLQQQQQQRTNAAALARYMQKCSASVKHFFKQQNIEIQSNNGKPTWTNNKR
ncbi:PREDICTED: transcriptional activator protein DAL81-like [Rhagoletis zephyria]|uniref:transcriptional activator protein DAL81-like n=1 Tax=Rhagoletis zephyria TaxID=28612 RepID=UPI00081160BD|nr:PREDICTED: transcriptional activator protein DAL81-like [Rhagoletis zephyria]